MPTPYPHQIEGAQFLAAGGHLLADDPRVGKTAAAIMACDFVLSRRILVVTTATGRANFAREFREWQAFPRRVQVLYGALDKIDPLADVLVVAWSIVADKRLAGALAAWPCDVLVLDESHYAKSVTAKRTSAAMLLAKAAARVFCLSGTPMPNAPNDLWPMLATLAPERIDNMDYDAFVRRFCVTRAKFMGGKRIEVVVNGKNLPELRERLQGFWLRRTQADVGIREPIYSVLSVEVGGKDMARAREAAADLDLDEILAAAETGETRSLEVHMGPLRRITGVAKAVAIADLVNEEMESGSLDRIVLMCWHTEVMRLLAERLDHHGAVRLDGSTTGPNRDAAVRAFQTGKARVFIGQIQAAGEAIDLSSSCNLIFVEASWTPKDMRQASLRITNHAQKRQCLVRFAALAGSIDEALTSVLTRKVATIREVMKA